MAKRIFLFLAANLLIMAAITIVVSVLEIFFPGLRRGGLGGLLTMCLIWGMVGSFVSLQISRWMAKRSLDIQLVDGATGDRDLDWLHETVARLAQDAALPMPEVGVYDSPEVNAFATGPSKSRSLVAVSSGLFRTMNRAEIEGVLGHELTHVANGDMVTMALLQGVVNAFVMFFARIIGWAAAQALSGRDREDDRGPSGAEWMIQMAVTMVMQVALGVLASLVTSWFSRRREFRADAGGARLAGRDKMIGALRKLRAAQDALDPRAGDLATLKISGKSWLSAFSTHPPLEVRIEALERGTP
jgi:heat shock protein HtpX